MKAVEINKTGGPEVLEVEEITLDAFLRGFVTTVCLCCGEQLERSLQWGGTQSSNEY